MPADLVDPMSVPPTVVVEMVADAFSVRDGLRRAMRTAPLGRLAQADRSTAEIVLAEVLNNIVEHAYDGVSGPIRLSVGTLPGRVFFRIEDEGRPMPGETLPLGHLPAADDLAEGGFGWHLIRTLSCNLSYRRENGVNCLDFCLPAEHSAG